MNDFRRDDQWQKKMRDEFLIPYYRHNYRGFALLEEGRFAEMLQKSGCDTLVWDDSFQPIAVEEKIVRCPQGRDPYTAICLETESCTTPGYIRRGWMWYSKADVLLYCMHQHDDTLDCLWIDFPKLHEWFWPLVKYFPVSVQTTTINKTASCIVPIDEIARAQIPMLRFPLVRGWSSCPTADGEAGEAAE
jgi:hypothetical protein